MSDSLDEWLNKNQPKRKPPLVTVEAGIRFAIFLVSAVIDAAVCYLILTQDLILVIVAFVAAIFFTLVKFAVFMASIPGITPPPVERITLYLQSWGFVLGTGATCLLLIGRIFNGPLI